MRKRIKSFKYLNSLLRRIFEHSRETITPHPNPLLKEEREYGGILSFTSSSLLRKIPVLSFLSLFKGEDKGEDLLIKF